MKRSLRLISMKTAIMAVAQALVIRPLGFVAYIVLAKQTWVSIGAVSLVSLIRNEPGFRYSCMSDFLGIFTLGLGVYSLAPRFQRAWILLMSGLWGTMLGGGSLLVWWAYDNLSGSAQVLEAFSIAEFIVHAVLTGAYALIVASVSGSGRFRKRLPSLEATRGARL